MTARVALEEFLGAYLAEVDEHLSAARARILALEASIAKAEPNPRAVRDLFRALHTIKGLSAMVGVEPVVVIAHRMEAVLRACDRAGGTLGASALEVIVDGARAIEHRVRALGAGEPVPPPPDALLAALDGLEAGGDGRAARARSLDLEPAIRGKLAVFEEEQLARAADQGSRAVRLEFIPSAERAAQGLSITVVRERLASLAEIVKVVPVALSPGEGAPTGLVFVLLLVTTADDAALADAAGVPGDAVRAIGLKEAAGLPAMAVPVAGVEAVDEALPDERIERRNVLRVDVTRVDDAMEKLASLIVSRSRLTRIVGGLDLATAHARELRQITNDIGRQLRDLRASILHVRMVGVAEVLDRLPMVVRALRRSTGKEVRLEIDAGEAELDKAVAERIFPAILHLARNAVDHGVETPEARRAAGKPAEGVLRIAASSRSNAQLEIVVSDDGAGVDPVLVAARAGVAVPSSEAALLDLLCRPGLSTRTDVTTTSGRGMGMDIVRRVVVDELGGELLLATRAGFGTAFTLRVPLTIAVIDAFTTQCSGQRFVVPVSAIEEIVEIEASRVVAAPATSAAHVGMFERRGEAVPLLDLTSLLALEPSDDPPLRALVVRRAGQPVAFALHRVLGQQEAVVRPLLDPLVSVAGVSGATDLGDGRPTLVLDLIALAAARSPRPLRAPGAAPPLPAAPRRALGVHT